MINNNFNVICKKSNQTSVSDADRNIPTLDPTDNAGNSVNFVSGTIRLPSGWDFSVCIGDGQTEVRFLSSPFNSAFIFSVNFSQVLSGSGPPMSLLFGRCYPNLSISVVSKHRLISNIKRQIAGVEKFCSSSLSQVGTKTPNISPL